MIAVLLTGKTIIYCCAIIISYSEVEAFLQQLQHSEQVEPNSHNGKVE